MRVLPHEVVAFSAATVLHAEALFVLHAAIGDASNTQTRGVALARGLSHALDAGAGLSDKSHRPSDGLLVRHTQSASERSRDSGAMPGNVLLAFSVDSR